jgi:hypothetical protein
MPAEKGNKYWQFRDKHGRDHKYTPETLWDEAVDYFNWVEQNPLWESVLVSKGIVVNKGTENEQTVYSTSMPKMRAMTLKAFQLFADISHTTWDNYCNNKDFVAITTRIKDTIYSQKFEGAAATLLNPNIIARDLGLTDNQKFEHSGEIKTTHEKLTPERAKEIDEALENEC